MLQYNKIQLANKAKKLCVVRDTLEKVIRLSEILKFFSINETFNNSLALKGGTAINLLFFNLPRLSVDIDMDFCLDISKDDMLLYREKINKQLLKFMYSQGYILSGKSKNYHSLDSLVFDYTNSAMIKDNIKIEINYSLREHVLPIEKIELKNDAVDDIFLVNTVNPIEIYATKTVALLTRNAPRDLYDLNYMIVNKFLSDNELDLYHKCVIFYFAIATENPIMEINFNSIDNITPHKIKTSLVPVVRDRDAFKLEDAKNTVINFIKNNINISDSDLAFLSEFKNGNYRPELLFNDEKHLNNIRKHPMAIWKITKNKNIFNRKS